MTILRLVRRRTPVLLAVAAGGLIWHNWRLWRREASTVYSDSQPVQAASFADWPRRPKMTALVAAWNECRNIEEHIRSFLNLSYPDKELVLCAGGEDGTYFLARRHAGAEVKVLEQQPGEGKQAALRRCLAEASGDLIVLSDADCVFSDDALLCLIEPLARGTADVVTGVAQPKVWQRANRFVRYQWYTDAFCARQLPPTVDGVLGRNCALWRSVLEEVGGFDAPARTGTDFVLSRLLQKAGYVVRTVPQSSIETEYPESPAAYLRMWRRWDKNLLLQGARYESWRHVRGILTASALYILILAVLPASAFAVGPVGWGSSLLLFAAGATNRFRRYALGARLAASTAEQGAARPIIRGVRAIPEVALYTGLDMLAVLLAVCDAISPRMRGRW